ADSSWHAPDWQYRKMITIDPATPLANYQVKVELTPSNFDYSKAKSDGGDLRFYQADGIELDYWIENWNTSGTSTIWVEVTTSGTDTIYMYYGNPSASSASNGTATFEFFDDFEDGVLTDKWIIISGSPTIINGELVMNRGDEIKAPYSISLTDGHLWEWEFLTTYVYSGGISYNEVFIHFAMQDTNNTLYIENDEDTYASNLLRVNKIEAGTASEIIPWKGDPVANTWYLQQVIRLANGTFYAYNNGDERGPVTDTFTPTVNYFDIYLGSNCYETHFDNIRVRKYASPEPSAIVGAEETHIQWLPGFSYRRPIIIDNTANSNNLTDYQISVTMDTASLIAAGKMRSDCGDIRFTDSDGTTLLNYWLESGCNTTNTKLWVKVHSIPAGETKTIYMYYGNPSASSASNGTATFEFFDDFEDGVWTDKWEQHTWYDCSGHVDWSGQKITESDGQLHSNGRNDDRTPLISVKSFPGADIILESRYRYSWADTCSGLGIGVFNASNDWVLCGDFPDTICNYAGRPGCNNANYIRTSGVFGSHSNLISDDTTNGWRSYRIAIHGTTAELWYGSSLDDLTQHVSVNFDTPIASIPRLKARIWISESGLDMEFFRVRKYASPEPSISVGNETTPENILPIASFSFSPIAPIVNQPIILNASSSYDSDGHITKYEWDFGDGTKTTGKIVTHSYSSPGNYTVTLTVTDNKNASSSASHVITISPGIKRKKIAISGSSSNLTDYQVKLIVDYDPDMRPDYADLRFTTPDGEILNYWLENYTTSNATVWVKVPFIPTNGTTIYMYYGKPSAFSLSNGTATFEAFDLKKEGPVTAGYIHSSAVIAEGSGTAKSWGNNWYGQLGDGTTTDRYTPVSVSEINNVIAIASGAYHTCALLSDGTVKCWGYNGVGQLGDGTTIGKRAPVSVSEIENATAITAGYYHTCALLSDGTVKCWGYNNHGQLGDGTRTERNTPVSVSGIADAVAISAGFYHTCALLANGTVKCWGMNSYGQLGDGTTTERTTPVLVSGIKSAVAISSGGYHTCALLADGTIKCWGYNAHGQLGDGTTINRNTPVNVTGITGAVAIAAGSHHSCAMLANGRVKCWGFNNHGQLGDGTTTQRLTPVNVSELENVTSISAGYYHTCALLANGKLKCFGLNDYGQLGDGTTMDRYIPVEVHDYNLGGLYDKNNGGIYTIPNPRTDIYFVRKYAYPEPVPT
ncbi:MAG: hypothetical protein DRJ43_03785, partial [Thermoprotei archaeon]